MTVSPNETYPAIFLDRDGTLMRDVDYCGDPAKVEVFPGATEALRQLKAIGLQIDHHHEPKRDRPGLL